MSKTAIEVDNVSMKFNLSREKVDSLKDYIFKTIKREIQYNEFWALKNVSFSVEKGDRVGILGLNGAGKSTLLKVISGVFKPTEGHVDKHGKMVPLLELGAGFDPQYTGKENIYLYGAMLGYTRAFMDKNYSSIIGFAELEDFQDRPFKQLSSGMQSRLAFSIACLVNPDILILDEVLSVGDGAFREKSANKMKQILSGGVTGILVSHSVPQVRSMCNKILWIDHGHQVGFSNQVKRYCDAYEEFLITKKLPKDEDEICQLQAGWMKRQEKHPPKETKTEEQKLLDILKSADVDSAKKAAKKFLAS